MKANQLILRSIYRGVMSIFEGYADANDAKDTEKKIKQFSGVYSQLKLRIRRSLGTEKVRG